MFNVRTKHKFSIFGHSKDKRQKLKVYNDVYGRLYGCHTTKTAKIKKDGDNTLQYIARMSMYCSVVSPSFLFLQF